MINERFLRKGLIMATIVNERGNIIISPEVIATIVGISAEQCYGIVGMSSKSAGDGIARLLHLDNYSKGIKVRAKNEVIDIDMFVIVEYGVSINAVAQSAKDTIKYNVEKFTGVKVGKVNVSIQGVRIEE